MLPIQVLPLFLVLGYFLTSFLIWHRLVDLGYSEEKIFDFLFWGGVIGVGLFFFLPFSGFWLGFFVVLFFLSRRFKWAFWLTFDEVVYGLLPGLVLIQVGNFLGGRLAGKPTSLPWGIYLPVDLLRRQPVSLYGVFFVFFLWLFFKVIERQWRGWSWFKGKSTSPVAVFFLFFISLGNLLLAFCREIDLYFFWSELFLSLAGILLVLKEVWLCKKTFSP